jgi:hypothetical protein
MNKRRHSVKILLAVAALTMAAQSLAVENLETEAFNPQAKLSADGRQLTIGGQLPPCGPNETIVELETTIFQDPYSASVNGYAQVACVEGQPTRFVLQATVPATKPAFVTGQRAQACGTAFARPAVGGPITDIKFWCGFVTLVTG